MVVHHMIAGALHLQPDDIPAHVIVSGQSQIVNGKRNGCVSTSQSELKRKSCSLGLGAVYHGIIEILVYAANNTLQDPFIFLKHFTSSLGSLLNFSLIKKILRLDGSH